MVQRALLATARLRLSERKAVLLVGAAGIGKTTLARSLLAPLVHMVGQALPAFGNSTYRPLVNALHIDMSGRPEDVASDVVGALDGRTLCMEDLHWADSPTLEVLDHLVGRVSLLMTARHNPGVGADRDLLTIEVRPLEPRAAAALAQRLHPHLGPGERARLVNAAAGNPLLLRTLATESAVTTTLTEAVAARLDHLREMTRDALGMLALQGCPSPPSLVGLPDDSDCEGLLVAVDGSVWFSHALLAQAVIESLSDADTVRLRWLLVGRCDDADAARHLLALGERLRASEHALRATVHAPRSQRADLLALAVDGLGEACSARVRLDAGKAMVESHRPAQARDVLSGTDGFTEAEMAEADLYLGQAAWLDGDVEIAVAKLDSALARVDGHDTRLRAQIVVERTTVAVRTRVGDPTLPALALEAVELAELTGVARARAHNVAGQALSHSGQPGWTQQFRIAADVAWSEDDHEEECAAAYWMVSALGFYGPMTEALDLGADMLERARSLGLQRWALNFLGARMVHLIASGRMQDADLADGVRLLAEQPRFRNRAQVELAVGAAYVDRLQFAEAAEVIRAGRLAARSREDRALIACTEVELAAAGGDTEVTKAAVIELLALDAGFFGLNVVAESAALHALIHAVDDWPVPVFATILTPVLDVVRAERRGVEAWRSHDQAKAVGLFADAAREWERRSLHRFAHRARTTAIELAIMSGSFDRASSMLDAAATRPMPCGAGATIRIAALHRTLRATRARGLLSPREAEALSLVGRGLSSVEIGVQLGLSKSTVDSHVDSACRKLGCGTRRQAAALLAGRTA